MELPDSENPHVLLGVPPDVDARDLKRAYVRLIKQFRPEQHPEAFQRIQQAYEAVRGLLGNEHPAHDDTAPSPRTIFDRPEPQQGYVHAGRPSPEPMRDLSSAPETEAHPEPTPSSRAEESPAEPDEALEALRCDDADEAKRRFDALHAQGKLAWQALRSRPDRHVALILFNEHIERELLVGRGLDLLAWLGSADFEREVLRVPGLESVVWRVLCFTCMQAPEASLAVLRAHPGSASTSDPNLALLEETLPTAETYRVMRAKGAIPPWLARLFEYGALETHTGTAAREVNDALGRDSHGVLVTLDTLQREAPSLLKRVQSTVDRWLPPDNRSFQELSGPERAWLKASADEVDRAIDGSLVGSMPIWLVLITVGLVVWGFASLGLWLGLVTVPVSIVVMGVAMVKLDRRGYNRKIRGQLATRFAARGVSPDRVIEYSSTHKEQSNNLDRFHREIERDLALYALSALCRVSEKLNARNVEIIVPERVVIEHAEVKTEVVGVVPSAAAADMTCTSHPERKALHMCSGCARPLCSACTSQDPHLPPFCTSCVAPRNLALRKALEEQESNYRGTGSCILLFAAALLVLAVGDVDNGNTVFARNTGAAAAVVFLIGLSLRMLWPIARYTLLLFAALIVWLFPVGTALAFMAVKFAFSARAKRVFSAEYRSALATTPPMRIPLLYRSLDVLAVLLACLSVWLFVR